jgi:hypothetical protein
MKSKKDHELIFTAFKQQIERFIPDIDHDPWRRVIFPLSSKTWADLRVSFYNGVYYISEAIKGFSIEMDATPNAEIRKPKFSVGYYDTDTGFWVRLLQKATEWLKEVEQNYLITNRKVMLEYPLKYRKGVIPASVLATYFPSINHLYDEVGKRNTAQMIKLVEPGGLNWYHIGEVDSITANEYFHYCKIAYGAVGLDKDNEPGRVLYKRYADGRHEGLPEINGDDAEEFSLWLSKEHPKRQIGGHPWEILRGGNTSNVQLQIYAVGFGEKKWKIEVFPTGNSRMAEAVKIFLALHKSGKPISIGKPKAIRDQLLLMHNVGIMPEYDSLHRAVQVFPEDQKVYQVIHLYEVKKRLPKLLPFIIWEQLPMLIPKG